MKTRETHYIVCCEECGLEIEISKLMVNAGMVSNEVVFYVGKCRCKP